MKKLSLLLLTAFLFSCSTSEKTKLDILIDHANVVGVKTGQLMPDQQIGIRNDTIIFVREAGSNNDYTAAKTIDATGKFVIPGLWDMHVHFRGGEELIEENKNLLPLFIANGVTGVREAGGDMTSEIFKWREEIKSGTLTGPVIFTSGPKLDGPRATWAGSIPVTTKEEVIQAVDSLENMGVDFIKIYDSTISKEAYIWIIEEAKRRGITTSGHMPFTVMLEDAVNAGLGSVEHLYYILKGASTEEKEITQDVIDGKAGFWGSMDKLIATYDESQAQTVFEMLKTNNTYVVPTKHIGNTLSYLDRDNHENDEYLNYVGDGIIKTYQGRIRSAMRANEKAVAERHELNSTFEKLIPKMQAAGVSLLAGSDSGASNSYVYQGISLHQELAALVAAGLTPAEALRTATINGSKFMKMENFYGSVETGKSSDLLILNANPLEDITNTQAINTLVLGRKVFSEQDLKGMLEQLRKTNK
ncbi:amidohydrolase [Roseivirga seohaensis subsp. aquiponti]|uniref:Amidohydrolase n=1 Tax=Roseivirga seohaensis subsp. aquiponti TaxID=1566026 RepID=A0A0L8AKP1_9BACT|nr:amidohydrolase family protein [Roseivirga seohaensis]KOF02797.1 amidohydrolase [Roseivirga seohaensis subsp. aquiponti]